MFEQSYVPSDAHLQSPFTRLIPTSSGSCTFQISEYQDQDQDEVELCYQKRKVVIVG